MELYFSPPKVNDVKKFLLYALFLGNIAVIFALWWTKSTYYIHNPDSGGVFIALGRITGLLAEYFMLTQLVMVGRITWIERVFGFDKLNAFHRFVGFTLVTLLLSHPILLVIGYSTLNEVSLLTQFADFLANTEQVFIAYLSLLLLAFIIFISIPVFRKNLRYETWYFSHLLVYVAIGLALPHQLGTGDLRAGWPLTYWYVINFATFGSLLLYRFLKPLYLFFRHRFYVEDVVQESDSTWSIYISGEKMDKFRFEAGQYANINILARGLWQTHPFSFSSDCNGKFIRFSIKNSGDYTGKIGNVKIGARVIVDGPLGQLTKKHADREKYLFIAGGIGITPLRAMIEDLSREGKDVSLLYSSKSEKELVFKEELEYIQTKTDSLKVHYVLSSPAPGYETGRLDKEKIVRLVPDFFSREVYLCGPPTMMDAIIKSLRELGFKKKHIHSERFSF